MQNFFEPIEVFPTQSQIESATRCVRYCDIITPVNTSCPISLETFNDNDMVTVIRHCGHTFHTEYLMNWFRTNCRCPVCRYDIRDYNNTSSEYFNSSGTTIDSSNNNLERNTTNNTTNNTRNRFNEENINENLVSSLENIFNTEIFDASGNYTTNPTDMLASLLINTLNRNINTR